MLMLVPGTSFRSMVGADMLVDESETGMAVV